MRDSRSVAPATSTAEPFDSETIVSDGGLSAMRVLSSAARIDGSRVASGSKRPAAPAPTALGRDDRSERGGLTAGSPLNGPTVTGAGGGRAGNHVGGAMLPPPANIVALSDGTRISFGAVAELPAFEHA